MKRFKIGRLSRGTFVAVTNEQLIKLDTLIKTINGGCSAHCFSTEEFLKHTSIVLGRVKYFSKKFLTGLKIYFGSYEKVARSYKYKRDVNMCVIEINSTGSVYLISFDKLNVYPNQSAKYAVVVRQEHQDEFVKFILASESIKFE